MEQVIEIDLAERGLLDKMTELFKEYMNKIEVPDDIYLKLKDIDNNDDMSDILIVESKVDLLDPRGSVNHNGPLERSPILIDQGKIYCEIEWKSQADPNRRGREKHPSERGGFAELVRSEEAYNITPFRHSFLGKLKALLEDDIAGIKETRIDFTITDLRKNSITFRIKCTNNLYGDKAVEFSIDDVKIPLVIIPFKTLQAASKNIQASKERLSNEITNELGKRITRCRLACHYRSYKESCITAETQYQHNGISLVNYIDDSETEVKIASAEGGDADIGQSRYFRDYRKSKVLMIRAHNADDRHIGMSYKFINKPDANSLVFSSISFPQTFTVGTLRCNISIMAEEFDIETQQMGFSLRIQLANALFVDNQQFTYKLFDTNTSSRYSSAITFDIRKEPVQRNLFTDYLYEGMLDTIIEELQKWNPTVEEMNKTVINIELLDDSLGIERVTGNQEKEKTLNILIDTTKTGSEIRSLVSKHMIIGSKTIRIGDYAYIIIQGNYFKIYSQKDKLLELRSNLEISTCLKEHDMYRYNSNIDIGCEDEQKINTAKAIAWSVIRAVENRMHSKIKNYNLHMIYNNNIHLVTPEQIVKF